MTIVCLSYGERDESAKLWKKDGCTLDHVKSERRREAEVAAHALGVSDIRFFDLGDYPLGITEEAKFRLVDVMREVQPKFILSHSLEDPYNTDHPAAAKMTIECRMTAQTWGHNPGETILGATQVYLFEPHQTEQCGWKLDVLLDITDVWERKYAAIQCMTGQEHLWEYDTHVAKQHGVQAKRNPGGTTVAYAGSAAIDGVPGTHAPSFRTISARPAPNAAHCFRPATRSTRSMASASP